ncbi:MAG: UvrD-helicase domain-containing protein [Chloroflexia bacterium]
MTAEMRGGVPVTPQQAAIVDHVREHPVTVVSAGAGSGKTYTMVATVLDLIERGLATVNQFVLITFTNKAADELRERIERALADRSRRAEREGDDAGRRLWQRQQERLAGAHIGTIHSYCAHVLKTYGYGERVAHTADISMARSLFTETLADTTEASLAGPDALLFSPDLDWDDHHAAHIIGAILDNIRQRGLIRRSCWRRRAPSPTMTASSTGSRSLTSSRGRTPPTPRGRTTSSASIATTCSAARPISSLDGRRGGATALACAGAIFFIDEFQDTDRTQKRILDAHRDHLAGLLVVGDRKQSIYGFRAAVSTPSRIWPSRTRWRSCRSTSAPPDAQSSIYRMACSRQ